LLIESCDLGCDDLQACLKLDCLSLGGLWTAQQWQTELQEPARPVVGLRQQGELVALACGWVVLDELHITAVAVSPQRQRLGLGRQVLGLLLRRGLGLGAVRATLEVARSNVGARALYGCLGFQEAGVRRAYYRNGEDALIQWLNLATTTGWGNP
jgi:ribosomal-protein-alanine N-acetyltransferase